MTPANASSDQIESVARRIESAAGRLSLADDPATLEVIVNDLLAIANTVRELGPERTP